VPPLIPTAARFFIWSRPAQYEQLKLLIMEEVILKMAIINPLLIWLMMIYVKIQIVTQNVDKIMVFRGLLNMQEF